MSGAAQFPSSPILRLDASAPAAGALKSELAGWAWLAVGALAVAGVFALLLALSRVPGMDRAPFWPIGFFYKGLVIHVVFSLVIWLMGVFAFLVTAATQTASGGRPRAAPLGRIGQGIALVAFPFLFAPAFFDATQPELTNYIPLIRHPAYDLGLLMLAAGVLAPVIRLFLNLPGCARPLPALTLAMSIGGFVYLMALVSFAIAGVLLAGRGDLMVSRELLFWGGGHLMQFVYAIVLLTNWRILAGRSLGEKAVDGPSFRPPLPSSARWRSQGRSSTLPSSPSRKRSTRRSACSSSASRFRPSCSQSGCLPAPARSGRRRDGRGAIRRSSRWRPRSRCLRSAA